MGRGRNKINLSCNMVMADTKMYFSQDMGMKFFTNSKIRQPVVCTSGTGRPPSYFLNAGFTASTHHVKLSGSIGDKSPLSVFSIQNCSFEYYGSE